MSFNQSGDAGTAIAIQDALAEIAEGECQRVVDMIDTAPLGPIKTEWGLAFRDFDELVSQAERLLADHALAARLGDAATARAHRDHTYERRVAAILGKLT